MPGGAGKAHSELLNSLPPRHLEEPLKFRIPWQEKDRSPNRYLDLEPTVLNFQFHELWLMGWGWKFTFPGPFHWSHLDNEPELPPMLRHVMEENPTPWLDLRGIEDPVARKFIQRDSDEVKRSQTVSLLY